MNGSRVLRLEPNINSPNLIGGFRDNSVLAGTCGATIAGGGASGVEHSVTDFFGTIGGGYANTVSGGGGTSDKGEHALGGTIGQADAGAAMSGGEYSLSGGFGGVEALPASDHVLYLPSVNR